MRVPSRARALLLFVRVGDQHRIPSEGSIRCGRRDRRRREALLASVLQRRDGARSRPRSRRHVAALFVRRLERADALSGEAYDDALSAGCGGLRSARGKPNKDGQPNHEREPEMQQLGTYHVGLPLVMAAL